MRLTEGQRVRTPRGPGEILSLHNGSESVRGHGRPVRTVAYAVVRLDRNGDRRIYPCRELDALDR